MKLISLKIKGFKNLDFWENPIDFTKSEGISIFVGNNGSGKSNVLEAISAIFYGLYNKKDFDPKFEFELVYKITKNGLKLPATLPAKLINEYEFKIKHEENFLSFYVNLENISLNHEQINFYLPSQIIALYSGEETRLYEDYYKIQFDKYIDGIKNIKIIPEYPKMIFLDKSSWSIALLTMFFSVVDFNEKDLLYNGLEIILGKGINIKSLNFDVNRNNILKFNENEITEFAKIIDSLPINLSFKELKYHNDDKGLIGVREELYKNLSISYLGKTDSNKLINDIDILLDNGVNIKNLSEGQKKQILIYFVTQILGNKDSIILLDEPDSYIHVGNKDRLEKFFKDFIYSNEQDKSKHIEDNREGEIIMTTHSPTLMNRFYDKYLFYLENGKLGDNKKANILKQIAGDSMSYTEQQIILNTNKDIIIVEGKTDETYIKTALDMLKKDNLQYKSLDFEFLLMGGSDPEILKRFSEKFPAKDGQKIMAFFDRDEAGYKCIKNALGEENLQKDTFNGKKIKDIYVNFYPRKNGFTQSNFEIEDYFRIEKIIEFMYNGNGIQIFGDTKSKLDKNSFAEKCKTFVDKSEFEGFKSLFDLILLI